MKRNLAVLFSTLFFLCCIGCKTHSEALASGIVNVTGAFTVIEAGGKPVTLTASVSGDEDNQGVIWTLSVANTSCSPACGTLKPSATQPGLSAVYAPPTTVPANQQATITARSVAKNQQVFAFNFQITAPIVVTISPKFQTQTAGGPVVNLAATITNDVTNAGLSWTLTAASVACSPQCGSLTVDPAPSLTAHYLPPATAPSGASASPTITAASVEDPSKTDSFSFTIVAPPISVSITNKFSTAIVGGAPVLVNVTVTNDNAGAGVTWALTSAAAPCSPACGTLTPSPAPSFSATYTPPTSVPTGANASPTIAASSVTDPTESDSFSFTVVSASSVFKGNYAFQLRGFDPAGNPMAMVGSIASDGLGNVTGGELDLDDNGSPTSFSGLSGSYTVDTSFNSIPRVTINLASGANAWVLKTALSADGTRGKVVEYDASLNLIAGTLSLQDPAALSAANPSGTYVFGLDSDAGTSTINGVTTVGRIVEAGQLIIGPGTSGAGSIAITGGVADASQSGAGVLFGGTTVQSIASGAAAAPDAYGRGTFSLSINGNVNNYVYYVLNSQQLNLIESDSGGVFMTVQSGTAQLQQPLTADSLNMPASVAALSGTTPSNGSVSTDVIVGVLTVSQSAASASFEFNSAGNVNAPSIQSPVSASSGFVHAYDPTTGRAVLVNTFFFGVALYLSDAGKGYIIDITPAGSGSNHAFSGPLVPQSPGPFSLQTHVYGNYIAIAGGSSIPALPNFDLAANLDPSGVWSGLIDFTSTDPNVLNGQAQNVSIGGEFTLSDPIAGRGVISLPAGAFGDYVSTQGVFASYYIIGPHQFVAIGQGPGGNGGDPSGILYFDPE